MEKEILKISELLYHNHLTPEMANVLLLDLFKKSNKELLPTQDELNARIAERLDLIKSTWNMPDDYYDGIEKGYMGCIEWLKER